MRSSVSTRPKTESENSRNRKNSALRSTHIRVVLSYSIGKT